MKHSGKRNRRMDRNDENEETQDSGTVRGKQSKFIVLPKATIDQLLKHERRADLIALLTFYFYTATWQGTNQPQATIAYAAKGLNWGPKKVRLIKSILVGMKLTEDVTQRNSEGKTEG